MSGQILTIGLAVEANDILKKSFTPDNMYVTECRNLKEASIHFDKKSCRLIIYDASALSPNDTRETVSKIRSVTYAPLIVLSTDEAVDMAYEAGADISAPPNADLHRLFSIAMGQIRRNEYYSQYDAAGIGTMVLYRGDLMIDSAHHFVSQGGKEIRLLPREFRLLVYLSRNPGIVLTPEQLGTAIWRSDHNFGRDVTKVVSDLRRKLGDGREKPIYIETIHGVGYRFILHE